MLDNPPPLCGDLKASFRLPLVWFDVVVVVLTSACVQVADLLDTASYQHSSTRIVAGHSKDAGQCDVIVITIEAKHRIGMCLVIVRVDILTRRPGESKLQSSWRNGASVRSAVESMKSCNPEAVITVVSNPNDSLTELVQAVSGLPKRQVIGAGTALLTLKLRALIASRYTVCVICRFQARDTHQRSLQLPIDCINTDIIEETGDSAFVAWSQATINGTCLDKAILMDEST